MAATTLPAFSRRPRSRDARLVAFVTGPTFGGGPRMRVRVEVVGSRREDCQAFLAALLDGMRRLNVYRGHVISLSPGQMGMGPQSLVAFHAPPQHAARGGDAGRTEST